MERRKKKRSSQSVLTHEGMMSRIVNRIRQSLELDEILTITAEEMRQYLGTDRVKVYRFQKDGNGEVVAESICRNSGNSELPSLLGLRFPHDDIPSQALQMFIQSRQRVITDVVSQRQIKTQLDSVETGATLEKADVRYSPVDPCHVEYLTTMGVASSLVLPLLSQGQLWGLLVSHHRHPRHFSEEELSVVQLLADQLSIAIAQSNLLREARFQSWHESTINSIISLLHMPLDVVDIRQQVLQKIVEAMQGSGGRLYITAELTGQAAQLYVSGSQPTNLSLEETLLWEKLSQFTKDESLIHESQAQNSIWNWSLQALKDANTEYSEDIFDSISSNKVCIINDLYQEPLLESVASGFKMTSIRSILVLPLQYQQQWIGCLSIFRDEVETQTLWAGRDHSDDRNIRPRRSFEAWCEIKRGQIKEWTQEEIKLAQALSIHLSTAVMQRRVENLVRHQASHDSLTGLPNRLLFNEYLSLALASAHRQGELLAVVFLDLDRFKTINDTLGHAVGDQLLKSAAQRLEKCLRKGDTVSRWGGDEFTLLLSDLDSAEDSVKVAQRILEVFSLPFYLEEQEIYVGASLGIALAPYDGEDVETLLKNADTAMYRVKQEGKNNYQFYMPAMNTKALEQLELENNLHKALIRREFVLHYQPQVDLRTGHIIAMEALIRWNHPKLGFVQPNQFIPIAEETGLICEIGEWVLQTACEQNLAWQKMGINPIRIAVNLSARQFQKQDLVSKIDQVLKQTHLDPKYLELEITESIAIQNKKRTIIILEDLRNMGIQVSMDDFGTGHSSLSSLIGFPFHVLKIDRSFIMDSTANHSKAEIVRAIVTLGHALNLKIVAEGVEISEEVEFLRSIKCDSMQGYFFSRPLSAEGATELIIANSNLKCNT